MERSHFNALLGIATIGDSWTAGSQPGDLPILQPNEFDLMINTQLARKLGLVLSNSLLTRADEVVE
jgi:putative ABC transport system substrate-binding protein